MWFDFTKNCLVFDCGDGTERLITEINLTTLQNFTHIAICKQGTSYTIFVDGNERLTFDHTISLSGGFTLYIGCTTNGVMGVEWINRRIQNN